MDTRALLLGLGTGMLAATVVIGAGQVLVPNNTSQPPATTPQQPEQGATPATMDWQKAAQEAGMLVFSKADFEQKIAQAQQEGAKEKEAELAERHQYSSLQLFASSYNQE